MLSRRCTRFAYALPGSSSSIHSFHARHSSAWINRARADADSSLSSTQSKIDIERLFTDDGVQRLLADLTGLDLENKVFKPRRTSAQQRSHYALMTDERLEKTIDRMRDEARRFLQPVPIKEPRVETVRILSKDAEIAGFDQSKFIFTDITFDATDQDRTVVVREMDGTLRTATPEEHDRMNRVYYERPNRPVNPPSLFSHPYLQNALDRNEHEFVMDWACWFYEPDDPAFIKLSRTVFDRIVEEGKLDVLHSTRHFATLCFYLALNGNIPPLLNFFGGQGRVSEAANLIRLQKTLHPDWRVAITSPDSDDKICDDFIRQNERLRPQLQALIHFLKSGETANASHQSTKPGDRRPRYGESEGRQQSLESLRGPGGPLGAMSAEYPVKVSIAGEEGTVQHRPRRPRGPFKSRKDPQSKPDKSD